MLRYLPLRAGSTYFLALIAYVSPSPAQDPGRQNMIFGSYFEEWGIRYSGYNIADLQKNGVADQLTHLIYAFGNVTATATPACAIADPSAIYQDSTLLSLSDKAYAALVYVNFGTIQRLGLVLVCKTG